MRFKRRTLLKGAAGVAAMMSLGAYSGSVAAADEESDGDGTTLERTLLRGTPGTGATRPSWLVPVSHISSASTSDRQWADALTTDAWWPRSPS